MATTSARRRGWRWDEANSELEAEINGTKILGLLATGPILALAGRVTETLTAVDDDSQHMTLAAADILRRAEERRDWIVKRSRFGPGGTVRRNA